MLKQVMFIENFQIECGVIVLVVHNTECSRLVVDE